MSASHLDGLETRPLAELTSAEAADAMNRSFEGYVVPVHMSPEAYERRMRAEDLDPYASCVLIDGGAPAGVVLVARRGWTSRIAAMGIVPGLRGQGVGRRAMAWAIDEAHARGDSALLLEVIEQNVRALRLYESLGFQRARRLVGWRREPGAPSTKQSVREALVEVDPLTLSRVVAREGEPDLPWALTAETLSAASAPARALHLEGEAYALVADPAAATLVLSALIVRREARRRGWGRALWRQLEQAFPGCAWLVPPVVPEGVACGFFEAIDWERHPISQLEMTLTLRRAPVT